MKPYNIKIIMILVLIAHVIGAGILIGGTIFSIYLISGKKVSHTALQYIHSFGNIMKYAALTQLITGVILFSAEADKFRGNKFFWIKMILYIISGILAGGITKKNIEKLQKQTNPNVSHTRKLMYSELLIILLIVSIGVFLVESD